MMDARASRLIEPAIDVETLRSIVGYDPDTGDFWWLVTERNGRCNNGFSRKAGEYAGWVDAKGYRKFCIRGRHYFAHRAAWAIVHNKWPELYIDHINRNASDNRIANLREATRDQNNQNRTLWPANKTGYRGVTKHGSKWRASISVNNRLVRLGIYSSPEEASAKYIAASKEIHGEFRPTDNLP